MSIIVRVAGRFGSCVRTQRRRSRACSLKGWRHARSVHAAGTMSNQTEELVCVGGNICEDGTVWDEINHSIQRAHDCLRRNRQAIQVCDRRSPPPSTQGTISPSRSRGDPFLRVSHGTWSQPRCKLRRAHQHLVLRRIGLQQGQDGSPNTVCRGPRQGWLRHEY
ncbi:unnamed protein product [Pylaiella littoralis]